MKKQSLFVFHSRWSSRLQSVFSRKFYIQVMACLVVSAVLALPSASMASGFSSSDLWDVSQGNVVTSTSGPLYYSSSYRSHIDNMFGGALGTIEVGNTLFKDYMLPGFGGGPVPTGYTHYVEWQTTSAVTLRSFVLHSSNENRGSYTARAFDNFELFVGDGLGSWTSIFTQSGLPLQDPDHPWQLTESDVTAVTSQYFRATFQQHYSADNAAKGPRIMEFDGFDTFLDGTTGAPIPEPATVALLGIGLAGLAGAEIRRRRKKKAVEKSR